MRYNIYMCGRYSLEFDKEFYKRYKTANQLPFESHYNIAPSKINPVIVAHSPNQIQMMVWGLVPFWEEKSAKPKGLINVRDDTVLNKGWAHKYLETQRCLVPASGFYEWQKTGGGKIPYFFQVKKRKYFSFAGMYSIYKNPLSGEDVYSYTIITTSPNHLMETIHNRMPVILKQDDEEFWLNPDETEIECLKPLLRPYDSHDMQMHPVSARVNNPVDDDPGVTQPAPAAPHNSLFSTPDSR